jgi:tetratricopeptide (TPR) repeat protein
MNPRIHTFTYFLYVYTCLGHIKSLQCRAKCFETIGNSKEAITDYTTLLQLQPYDTTYLYKRAILYDKNNLSENSLRDITKAINKNKNSYRSYDRGDQAYIHVQKYI